MTKLYCQNCGNPVELDLQEFRTAGISSADCPHCGAQIRLFDVPFISPPQIPLVAKSKPKPQNISFGQVVSWIALIGFFGWSALIVLWGLSACFGWVKIGLFAHHSSDAENVGAFLGVVFSLAILFGVWLIGAIPSFMVWFIFKKRN